MIASKKTEINLENKAWQDVKAEDVGAMHSSTKCRLVWLDPWYQLEHQPSVSDRIKMRELLDDISQPGTVQSKSSL